MNNTTKGTAEFLRFLITHAAIGVAGAVAMVGLCLATDFLNLWTLVSSSDAGPLAVAVMTVFFAITFASVQMGFAIMLRAEDNGPPRAKMFRLVPARVTPREGMVAATARASARKNR
ncbi:hypothetical protein [Acuticoccus kandeliae]|uniref:hypothetical protein n=1 Tax=Acuticoccus kandeliae TaxID=2073160 RepID=UPI000D3E8AF6|nr:hypothetical protein [Acuticoccus kandeliae]